MRTETSTEMGTEVTDFDRPSRFALWCCRMGWHPQRYRRYSSIDGLNLQVRCNRCGLGLPENRRHP